MESLNCWFKVIRCSGEYSSTFYKTRGSPGLSMLTFSSLLSCFYALPLLLLFLSLLPPGSCFLPPICTWFSLGKQVPNWKEKLWASSPSSLPLPEQLLLFPSHQLHSCIHQCHVPGVCFRPDVALQSLTQPTVLSVLPGPLLGYRLSLQGSSAVFDKIQVV